MKTVASLTRLHTFIIACVVLFSAKATTAGVLKGVVIENEEGGAPVAGVAVSADGTNTFTTKKDGLFKLRFPNKQPGEEVKLTILKPGYVVVNDLQLEQILPVDADKKLPLTILICRPASREEMARRYYRLKSVEAIEANYRKLLKENQSNLVKIAQLQKEHDQAIGTAEKTAEELAKTKPGQASELYNRAMRLFLDAQIEEALNVLDDEHLRSNLEATKRKKAQAQKVTEEANKEIEQTAQSWVLRARLLTLEFKFDEAERTYLQAIQAAPDSYDVQFAFAYFSQELNHYIVADEAYQRCLGIARTQNDTERIAIVLSNLGALHTAQKRVEEARRDFDESLGISRGLSATDSESYLPLLATTLNNKGILELDRNQLEAAQKAFEEALKITRELVAKAPEVYQPDMAGLLNNLGNVHRSQSRMDEARKVYDESLSIYRVWAVKEPGKYRFSVARVLNNLGILSQDQNRTEEAYKNYKEALQIFQTLAATNPETFLPYVAETLKHQGNLCSGQQRKEEAGKDYEEALRIYRNLAAKNPELYLPNVAEILRTLGLAYRDETRMEEALQIYRDLATKYPDTYAPNLALTLSNLGLLRVNSNQTEKAIKNYEEALDIRKEFAERHPEPQQREIVASTLFMLGSMYIAEHQIQDASKAFKGALDIFQGLEKEFPGRFHAEITSAKALLDALP